MKTTSTHGDELRAQDLLDLYGFLKRKARGDDSLRTKIELAINDFVKLINCNFNNNRECQTKIMMLNTRLQSLREIHAQLQTNHPDILLRLTQLSPNLLQELFTENKKEDFLVEIEQINQTIPDADETSYQPVPMKIGKYSAIFIDTYNNGALQLSNNNVKEAIDSFSKAIILADDVRDKDLCRGNLIDALVRHAEECQSNNDLQNAKHDCELIIADLKLIKSQKEDVKLLVRDFASKLFALANDLVELNNTVYKEDFPMMLQNDKMSAEYSQLAMSIVKSIQDPTENEKILIHKNEHELNAVSMPRIHYISSVIHFKNAHEKPEDWYNEFKKCLKEATCAVQILEDEKLKERFKFPEDENSLQFYRKQLADYLFAFASAIYNHISPDQDLKSKKTILEQCIRKISNALEFYQTAPLMTRETDLQMVKKFLADIYVNCFAIEMTQLNGAYDSHKIKKALTYLVSAAEHDKTKYKGILVGELDRCKKIAEAYFPEDAVYYNDLLKKHLMEENKVDPIVHPVSFFSQDKIETTHNEIATEKNQSNRKRGLDDESSPAAKTPKNV